MAINQRKAGTMLSYVQLVLSTVIGLCYTPIMLNILGQGEYGLFGTASSLTSFLSLLSFGVSGSYMKFVMEYRVTKDKHGENKLNGMFLIIYSVFSLLVIVVGSILIFCSDSIFANSLSSNELYEVKWIMFFTIINYVFSFISTPIMMCILSFERYFFIRILAIALNLINPIINIVLLSVYPYAVTISVITTAISVLTMIIYWLYAYKKLDMRFEFKNFSFTRVKSVFIFSSFLLINEITNQIVNSTDRLVLSVVSGTVAVAIYQVASNFSGYFSSFSSSVSGVFAPSINKIVALSKAEGTNPDAELNKLFVKIGRIQFLILTLAIVGFSCLGRQFVLLWAGPEYEYSFWIALILLLTPYIPFIQNTGLEIQKAKNKHKVRSVVYLCVGIVNAGLTIPITCWFLNNGFGPGVGGIVAASVTLVSVLLGQVVFMNIYYQKKIGVNVINFWKNIIRMLPGVLIPFALGLIITNIWFADNYLIFAIQVLIIIVLYGGSVWLLSMNEYEKNLVKGPIKKIIGKFKRKKG